MPLRTFFSFGLFLFSIFLLASPAFGQSTSASLSGVVTDQTKAVIAGAKVTVTNNERNFTKNITTDEQGRYVVPVLEPGVYSLVVEAQGFNPARLNNFKVSLGENAVFNIVMIAGGADVDYDVFVDSPPIATTAASVSRVIFERPIQNLPLSGRNFVDFVKLSPGVAPGRENVGGGPFKEPDVAAGSAAVPRISFGGQTELNTLVLLDGLDNIQTVTGLPRATPSTEAVREFIVLNNSYETEYGRSLGGFVNIVTKAGSNGFHGSAYYFGVNDAVSAQPLLAPSNHVLRQNQFGGTLGGYLKKDRAFFFTNYEGQRRAESNRFSQVIISNLAGINAARAFYGLNPETTSQVRTSDYDQFLARFDFQISTAHHLTTRLSYLNGTALGFLGGGGRASPASTTARENFTEDVTVSAQYTAVMGPTKVNELRFQFGRRDFRFNPRFNQPALELPNLIVMGKSTSDIDFYKEDRVQIADAFTWVAGNHTIKFGGDYNRLADDARWDLFYPARIIYGGLLPAFLNQSNGQAAPLPSTFWFPVATGATRAPNIPVPFTQAIPTSLIPNATTELTHAQYGFFIQDQWRIRLNHLTLTYGIRNDFETYPSRFQTERDYNNWQPRVGLAWSPFDNQKTVVRAGYGVFTDRIASSIGQVIFGADWITRGNLPNAAVLFPDVARIQGRFQQFTIAGAVSPTSPIGPVNATNIFFLGTNNAPAGYGVPVGSVIAAGTLPLPSSESGAAASFTDNLSSKLKNPYAQNISLQVEHQIGKGFVASAGYLRVLALKLPGHTGNLNAVQTGTLSTGKPVFGARRFSEIGHFFVTDNIGASGYNGGLFELRRSYANHFGLNLAYTWSKTLTTVDSVNNLADYPEAQKLDRFLSRQHAGHRFTASFFGDIPERVRFVHGFKLSTIISLESGRPFNVFAGGDFNGDGNPNSDRPGLLPRNSFQGPGFASVDLRVGRDVRFHERVTAEFTVDAFNLFNRINVRDLNLAYGGFNLAVPPNPTLGFGTPRDVFGARQIQFGVKVKF